MKTYKITIFKKGKKEEVILKAENKVEAIKKLNAKGKEIIVKAEEIDIPFEEKMQELTKIIKSTFSKTSIAR